jgi:hypothetical protein
MAEASTHFFVLSILVLVAGLLVFAMKYASAAYQSRLKAKWQTDMETAMSALGEEMSRLSARMSSVEKLLREVE